MHSFHFICIALMHSIRLPARWDDKFAKLKFSLLLSPSGMLASPLSPHMFGFKLFDQVWKFFMQLEFEFFSCCIRIKSIIAREHERDFFTLPHSSRRSRCMHASATMLNAEKGFFCASTLFCVELSYILCTIVGSWWKMIFFTGFSLLLSPLASPRFAGHRYTELQHAKCIWWKTVQSGQKGFHGGKTLSLHLIQSEWDSDKLKFFIYIFFSSATNSNFCVVTRLSTLNNTVAVSQFFFLLRSLQCASIAIYIFFFGGRGSARWDLNFLHILARLTISQLFFHSRRWMFNITHNTQAAVLVYIKLLAPQMNFTVFFRRSNSHSLPLLALTNIANIRSNIVSNVVFYHRTLSLHMHFSAFDANLFRRARVSQVSERWKRFLFHS